MRGNARLLMLLKLLATCGLISACAAATPDGKLAPEEAEAALQGLFSPQGERVLLQPGSSSGAGGGLKNQGANGAGIPGPRFGPDGQQLVGVSTNQGLIWMTRSQLDQYVTRQRAEAARLAQTIGPYGIRTTGASTADQQAMTAAPVASSAAEQQAPAQLVRASIPSGFDRYVAPELAFTIGPNGFRNADGSFDCVLTFDDGPHHSNDAAIYDILDAKGIRATFFFLGENVQANPTTALTAVTRGHEVGYHSWDHKNLRAESRATIDADFEKGMAAFNALGLQPTLFRPPFGNYNASVLEAAAAYGMTTVNWTNDSLDWQIKSPDSITQRVLSLSAPGDIVLLHSIHSRTVDALPDIIDGLTEQGCRFTSLNAWMARATS